MKEKQRPEQIVAKLRQADVGRHEPLDKGLIQKVDHHCSAYHATTAADCRRI